MSAVTCHGCTPASKSALGILKFLLYCPGIIMNSTWMPDCKSAICEIPKYSFEYGPHFESDVMSCEFCADAGI